MGIGLKNNQQNPHNQQKYSDAKKFCLDQAVRMAEQAERIFNDFAITEQNLDAAYEWSEAAYMWNSRILIIVDPEYAEKVNPDESDN